MSYQPNQSEALDLRSYMRPIWRRKWIILLITIVAAGATYYISSHQRKSYTATTELYVTDADPTGDLLAPGSDGIPTPTALSNVAQLMTAGAIAQTVARELGPSAFAGSVSATPSPNSSFITVTATSNNPVLAERLANAYVRAFVKSRMRAVAAAARKQLLGSESALQSLPKGNSNTVVQRQQLVAQISDYQQVVLNPPAGAQQINPAAVPGSPSSHNPEREAIFGGLAGLVLAIILAFCLEMLDRTLISVGTVEAMFRRPILAVLPHVGDPAPLTDDGRPMVPGEFIEALRSLAVVLRLSAESDPPDTIMVTSTLAGEGKSTVTRDLALVYAESTGQRVLVIDGDLRLPSMERLFGFKAERGLVHVLRGEASLSEAVVPLIRPEVSNGASDNGHRDAPRLLDVHRDAPPHLDVLGLPAELGLGFGSLDVLSHGEILDNPLPLMSSGRMLDLLAEAAATYDMVLMDTPPVLAVADAVPLLEVFDAVLLVARLSRTTRYAAREFRQLVARLASVNFAGVIANDRREDFDDGYSSYYRYGYSYYRGASGSGRSKRGRDERADNTRERPAGESRR